MLGSVRRKNTFYVSARCYVTGLQCRASEVALCGYTARGAESAQVVTGAISRREVLGRSTARMRLPVAGRKKRSEVFFCVGVVTDKDVCLHSNV